MRLVDAIANTGGETASDVIIKDALAQGLSVPDAVDLAVVAGALATRSVGAVPSLPTADEIAAARAGGGGPGAPPLSR